LENRQEESHEAVLSLSLVCDLRLERVLRLGCHQLRGPRAAATVIAGAKDYSVNAYGLGTNAIRCLYMSSGTLRGFTLTGGGTSPDNK